MVSEILGWSLDDGKSAAGTSMTLLGLHISVENDTAQWRLSDSKRSQWIQELREILASNTLTSGEASKWCGRLAFLNTFVFNRLGRALLRPLIWRQRQQWGSSQLTSRLKFALCWFLSVLSQNLSRCTPLCHNIAAPVVLLYSDAELNIPMDAYNSCEVRYRTR